jgi:TPR repeat protein
MSPMRYLKKNTFIKVLMVLMLCYNFSMARGMQKVNVEMALENFDYITSDILRMLSKGVAVATQDVYMIYNYYLKEDLSLKKEFQRYLKFAKKGDSNAQYIIGLMYKESYGVEFDSVKSAYWFNKALYQENPYALVHFAQLNKFKNINKSMDYLKRAANQNNQQAFVILGKMYQTGRFIEQDLTLAKQWYEKAILYHNPSAKYYLAHMYLTGLGVAKDRELGIEYLTEAANDNHVKAKEELAQMYYSQRNYMKAFYWYSKSFSNVNPKAFYKIGMMHKDGIWIKKDIKKAVQYFSIASNLGSSDALHELGVMHFVSSKKEDKLKSVKLFKLAANFHGNAHSKNMLAYMYRHGMVLPKNLEESYKLYQASALMNNASGLYNMGKIYEKGIGVEKDYHLALDYYIKAVNNGYKNVQCNIIDALGHKNISLYTQERVHAYMKAITQNINATMCRTQWSLYAKNQE